METIKPGQVQEIKKESPAAEAGRRLVASRMEVYPYFNEQENFIGFIDQYGQLLPINARIVVTRC